VRESWGSEMSMDSVTSVNSILSEEGSAASLGSCSQGDVDFMRSSGGGGSGGGGSSGGGSGGGGGQQPASLSLSCLLDSVPPPSNTPDSMARESPRPPLVAPLGTATQNSSTADSTKDRSGSSLFEEGLRLVKMGTKFKQQIEEIEAAKRRKKQAEPPEKGNNNIAGSIDPSDKIHRMTPQGAQVVGLAQLTPAGSDKLQQVKKSRLSIN
jgi:hypothetical protein